LYELEIVADYYSSASQDKFNDNSNPTSANHVFERQKGEDKEAAIRSRIHEEGYSHPGQDCRVLLRMLISPTNRWLEK